MIPRNSSLQPLREALGLCDVALRLVEAVTTGLVEGAEVLRVEAGAVEFAAEAVVLEDFVLGVAGAAAEDAELRVQAFGG